MRGPFTVSSKDLSGTGNGDMVIYGSHDSLVAVVYARFSGPDTKRVADVIASALNAAFCPPTPDLMTDLMVYLENQQIEESCISGGS